MCDVAWIMELSKWQTAISSLVGFVGVILTLIYNANMARARDDETRRNEARSLIRALLAECRVIKESLDRSVRELRRERNGSAELLFPSQNIEAKIFGSVISKIGLMSPESIQAVSEFHATYDTLPNAIFLFAQHAPAPGGVPYFVIAAAQAEHLAEMTASVATKADAAVRALEEEIAIL